MDSDTSSKIKASIDIGSNTVLLLVGEPLRGKVQVIYEEQHAPRLGKGVDSEKNLSQDSMQRVIEVLHQYKGTIEEKYRAVKEVKVVATSAVRDANNRQAFVDRIKREIGFSVEILSGEQEAERTFLGAQSVLNENNSVCAVIDIGGGSTEVAIGKSDILHDRHSFNIGSVRFTERYLKKSPPSERELKECRNAIKNAFDERLFKFRRETQLIGVAGTVTSCAAIELGHKTYQPDKLNDLKLTAVRISSLIEEFQSFTANALLERFPELLEGRADVFLAGLLILEGFMTTYNFPEVTVSTGGIRHGTVLTD